MTDYEELHSLMRKHLLVKHRQAVCSKAQSALSHSQIANTPRRKTLTEANTHRFEDAQMQTLTMHRDENSHRS